MKKIILLFIFILLLVGCEELISVPDVIGLDEETAIELLISNKFIPKIKYDYHSTLEVGKVFKLEPTVDEKVSINEPVNVYINLGAANMTSKESLITWYDLNNQSDDEWEFYAPKIKKEKLLISLIPYIDVKESLLEWEEYCTASLEASLNKTALCSFKKNNNNEYILEVDTNLLGVRTPNNLFIKLNYKFEGNSGVYNLEFEITW